MDLSGKKIAIYGLGVSGHAVLAFLEDKALGELIIVNRGDIASWHLPKLETSYEIRCYVEDECESALASCDLIILSPGIAREVSALAGALKSNVPVWNEIELAYHYFKAPIVAVTGTNGKTTTVSFLSELFKSAGYKVFTGGNIGTPFVCALGEESLKDGSYDLAILELSSFQCESLESFRAKDNIILNISPNHMERYDDVEDYRVAKWKMVRQCLAEDKVFIGEGVGKPPFEVDCDVDILEAQWDDEFKELFPWTKMSVIGAHNRYNLFFAWKVAKRWQISPEVFSRALLAFSGVAHRLERLVGSKSIFNDAKSTNWLATQTALHAVLEYKMPGDSLALIVGGQMRDEEDYPDAETLESMKKSCQVIVAIGQAAEKLQAYDEAIIAKVDLECAVRYLQTNAKECVILFSPAYPSFDQYKNYVERGNHFKKIIGVYNDH